MAYRDFKDLPRKTVSDEVLRVKAFDIAKNRKYYEYQVRLASMVYNIFYKNSSTYKGTGFKSENQQLVEKLKKTIIRKFEKLKVNPSCNDRIWGYKST